MSKTFPSLALSGFTVVAAVALSACGGSSSTTTADTSGGGGQATSFNVALASNGASITSSFSGNETFVIDGDTTAMNFWEARANGDTLTIDFSQSYSVESVTVYHTNMNSSTYFSMEFSQDGVSYTEVHNVTDCRSSLHFGASDYSCVFGSTVDARYFRFTILDNAVNIDIHEIEVIGQ